MAKYIIKRVAMGIFSIFIVATVTFFVMNLVPGGPFVAEKSISAAAQQALAEKYGLDKPLGVQYVNYMKSLLHGDLGLSLRQRGRTVNEIIASKLPVSCRLAGVAVLAAAAGSHAAALALYIALGLGVLAAMVELIAGIKGLKTVKTGENADKCVIWGCVVAGIAVVSIVMNLVGGGKFEITSVLLNLVLPALYIYGANQMKKAR